MIAGIAWFTGVFLTMELVARSGRQRPKWYRPNEHITQAEANEAAHSAEQLYKCENKGCGVRFYEAAYFDDLDSGFLNCPRCHKRVIGVPVRRR